MIPVRDGIMLDLCIVHHADEDYSDRTSPYKTIRGFCKAARALRGEGYTLTPEVHIYYRGGRTIVEMCFYTHRLSNFTVSATPGYQEMLAPSTFGYDDGDGHFPGLIRQDYHGKIVSRRTRFMLTEVVG